MSEEDPFAAANIEEGSRPAIRPRTYDMRERPVHRIRVSDSGKPAPGLRRFPRIPGVTRSPVLGLKEVKRTGAMQVERVPPSAHPARPFPGQPLRAASDRAPENHSHYSGIFPCFLGGFLSRFVLVISRPAMIRRRVWRGSMTSSMKPRSAAT